MQSLYAINLQILLLRAGGHVSTLLYVVGFVVAMKFLPAPSPELTPQQIAQVYIDNQGGIQIGATLMMMGFSFWIPWGVALACWIRNSEGTDPPVLTWLWLCSTVICTVIGVVIAFFWAVAAFRPGEIDVQITQTLNDIAWLIFLLPWAPFSLWAVALSLAILRDSSSDPVFPRWVAGLGFWAAFIFIPAMGPLFFKNGGFAWNGLLGMYLPVLVFWIWMEVSTGYRIRALQRQRTCMLGTSLGEEVAA